VVRCPRQAHMSMLMLKPLRKRPETRSRNCPTSRMTILRMPPPRWGSTGRFCRHHSHDHHRPHWRNPGARVGLPSVDGHQDPPEGQALFCGCPALTCTRRTHQAKQLDPSKRALLGMYEGIYNTNKKIINGIVDSYYISEEARILKSQENVEAMAQAMNASA
jgi:hypothetical protein